MIYISGPITGTDDYMERFAAAEKELTSKGYDVINPARYNAQLPKDTLYGDYIKISLSLLDLCGGVYMLNGWEQSNGARLEHAYAEATDIDIMYQTPPTEKTKEREYLWHLCGHRDEYSYLNVVDGQIKISSPLESGNCKTHFTAVEYLTIAEEHGFDSTSFVREEIKGEE